MDIELADKIDVAKSEFVGRAKNSYKRFYKSTIQVLTTCIVRVMSQLTNNSSQVQTLM